MSGLPIAWLTVREVVSRKLVLWGGVLSAVFVALFTLGFVLLYREVSREVAGGDDPAATLVVSGLLTVLGLYIVSFLASFLALFVSVGSVSAEADAGTLQAVIARPLPRWSWFLQRWGASAALVAGYTVLVAGALLLVARVVAGYSPIDPLLTVALMVAQPVLLLTLGMLGSTRLSTLANGVVVFSLFGLAWLGGIVEYIGNVASNAAMQNLGVGVSLLLPSDALWRSASWYAQSPTLIGVAAQGGGLPFAAGGPPTGALLAWAAAYLGLALVLALRSFARRDL